MTAVLILDRPPDRETLLDRLERASRTLPPLRHRLVEVPFRLSTPRWLVDPNFDLSYHVRWIAAPGDGSLDGVLEFGRQSAMSGLDQARPLWILTVVYPFGPLMGTAANCCLVGYDQRAFVGINADAAAVPDLDMLAGCIREGFDALIALADGG